MGVSRKRDEARKFAHASALVSGLAFVRVWGNESDAEYDRL